MCRRAFRHFRDVAGSCKFLRRLTGVRRSRLKRRLFDSYTVNPFCRFRGIQAGPPRFAGFCTLYLPEIRLF